MTVRMPPDLRCELLDALRAAANGAFEPSFYRVRISARRERRYRQPGRASLLSQVEARAILAFWYFEGCSVHELAKRFHRNRRTIRKALGRRQPASIKHPGEGVTDVDGSAYTPDG
jgi:hypothetical protein